jgi:predicted TIM-barrel enzyme
MFLLAGLVSGCGSTGLGDMFGSRAAVPVVVTAPVVQPADDPIAQFAADARPGATGTVGGQRARLVRVYHAASGRECREVLLGSGATERTAVACRAENGTFVSSRPLLRGSAR